MSSLRKDGPKPVPSSAQRPTPQSQPLHPQPQQMFYHSPHPAVEIWVDPIEMSMSVNVSLQDLPPGVSATGIQQPHSLFSTTHHSPTPAQNSFLGGWGQGGTSLPPSAEFPNPTWGDTDDYEWGAPNQDANSWGSWGDGQEHPVSPIDWGHSWGHYSKFTSDGDTLDGLNSEDDWEDDWEDVDEDEDEDEDGDPDLTQETSTPSTEPYLQDDDWFWMKGVDLSDSSRIYEVAQMLVNTLLKEAEAAAPPPTNPMLQVQEIIRKAKSGSDIKRTSMKIQPQQKKVLGIAHMFPKQNWVYRSVCIFSSGIFGNLDLPCYSFHSAVDMWDNCFYPGGW